MSKHLKQKISTEQAPLPKAPYSQAIRSGNMVFVSGQGPIDPTSGLIMEGDIESQTKLTLENVQTILQAAGLGMEHVVKATIHLSDLSDFAGFNQVYRSFFSEPYPARTTVGSQLLGIKVEIDVIAHLLE